MHFITWIRTHGKHARKQCEQTIQIPKCKAAKRWNVRRPAFVKPCQAAVFLKENGSSQASQSVQSDWLDLEVQTDQAEDKAFQVLRAWRTHEHGTSWNMFLLGLRGQLLDTSNDLEMSQK